MYPSWKSNLALFIFLIALVSGYFFLQLQKASKQFHKHSREHSEVVAGIVELNIRNTISSSNSLDTIYTGFLTNSARFLYYLDSVEPFTREELSAFSEESGLAGIQIIRGDGPAVSGSETWFSELHCLPPGELAYLEDRELYLLSYYDDSHPYGEGSDECVIVGVGGVGFKAMRQKNSLENLLDVLNTLPGIAYVKLHALQDEINHNSPQAILKDRADGETVSEHQIVIGENRLVVALEAEHFEKRMAQMRKELSFFILFLLVIGSFSSWWLYRSQKTRVDEVRDFERRLARQHEEAALGRAASTITHELRNPLNAINIGLQRLQFEADELSGEHKQLLVAMREAVTRSDNVITRLRQYIHDFQIEPTVINLSELVNQVIEPYRKIIDEQSIELNLVIDHATCIEGDRELLGQLCENIVRNGIEAQPDGGYLHISTNQQAGGWQIVMRNGGFNLTPEQGERLFQPYFTTKAKGTGLGLSISNKIAEAHKGSIHWSGDYSKKELTMSVFLPKRRSKKK